MPSTRLKTGLKVWDVEETAYKVRIHSLYALTGDIAEELVTLLAFPDESVLAPSNIFMRS